jgi:hypothetical protein
MSFSDQTKLKYKNALVSNLVQSNFTVTVRSPISVNGLKFHATWWIDGKGQMNDNLCTVCTSPRDL